MHALTGLENTPVSQVQEVDKMIASRPRGSTRAFVVATRVCVCRCGSQPESEGPEDTFTSSIPQLQQSERAKSLL